MKDTRRKIAALALLVAAAVSFALAGEKVVVSLKDMSEVELKMAGVVVPRTTTVHIRATGGGGDYGWTYKSNQMFAYAWIIDADTRDLVWKMDVDNTSRSKNDREFDGDIKLEPGSYEVYFTAYAFSYHTLFTHLNVDVDHREKPLFGTNGERKKHWFSFFSDWWSDDIAKDWDKRSKHWGIDVLVDEAVASSITSFTPPKEQPNVLMKEVGLKENELVRQGFSLSEPATLHIYAVGEGRGEHEFMDYGWIVNAADRSRVWDMRSRDLINAGGAEKNVRFSGDITLKKGNYVLYFITDDSHSSIDWNAEPPCDPLNWGITISAVAEKDRKSFKAFPYTEEKNVIVSLAKVGNEESRSEGFTLKEDSKVRIYALGERSNSRRLMADYGFIMDAKTRNKVWTMDVDHVQHGGGAAKNCVVDEIISLPKGSYIVTYNTDDSHAYDDWNASPPFDPEHYGITIMGAGERWDSRIVAKYVEEADKNIVAQIIKVGDDADGSERFKLDKTTRVRVYSIGEGQNRQMYDYGWIEDAKTGNVVWEMTYAMSVYAGGGRKNRMVNTTILLEKGEYKLRYHSDDSHCYGDWNVDPPDDQQFWGITLFKDDGTGIPPKPPQGAEPPEPPEPPEQVEEN